MGKTTAGLACLAAALWCGQVAAQQSPIPLVGVTTGIDRRTGQRPARKNINDLYSQGGAEWHLYVLALSALQAVNETDPLSYFSIAGIHGLPHSAWNGVQQVDGAPRDSGYCPHNDLLFPTWHRAYVALFEQTLVSHAVRIADEYPSRDAPAYKAAAQTLRQPYWDWASQANLPNAVTLVNITVNGPHGTVTVRNPLNSYRFQRPSVLSGFGGDLAQSLDTVRCGGPRGNNGTRSNEMMEAVAKDLTSYVYDVFTRTERFEDMAFDQSQASSFENPHNIVHNNAGCGGTIGSIDWSGFDPLFMLHHCNVDRLVAMWQAIHYDKPMFKITGKSTGQFGTPTGSDITADSPLKPFFNRNIILHTSNSATNISTFGYTYPEINDWDRSPASSADYIRSRVNALYNANNVNQAQRRQPTGSSPPDTRLHYYTAQIWVNRSEIPLPSTVNLVTHSSVVGRMSLLAMPRVGLASANLPLKGLTLGNGTIETANPSEAKAYLLKNLAWEVRRNDGVLVNNVTMQSLRVEIQGMNYVPRTSETGFPGFGKSSRWHARLQLNRTQ